MWKTYVRDVALQLRVEAVREAGEEAAPAREDDVAEHDVGAGKGEIADAVFVVGLGDDVVGFPFDVLEVVARARADVGFDGFADVERPRNDGLEGHELGTC